MKIKSWIHSFRLKTLPLALSNTIIGTCLAAANGMFRWSVFGLVVLTTVLLQILSNMANDYGDFVNGKDTAERIGPKRMVQSGEISPKTMLRGMIIVGILCAISGVSLIVLGTEGMDISNLLIFGLLGLAAIAAAIKYTVGKNPYGYRGLGDIFVFVFFGLVGVIGTYFLQTQSFRWDILLPAAAIGFLSTGVLNMNNMRDYDADKNAGKRTIVVAMGVKKAAFYHLFLVAGAAVLAVIYTFVNFVSPWQWFFLLSFPLLFLNLKKVFTYSDAKQLYPELPRLSMASLVFALTFGIGLLL
jgi:1,4-dihydroxy-2-naphthoate octaprenyltransferase